MKSVFCLVTCGLLATWSWCHAGLKVDKRQDKVFFLSCVDDRGAKAPIDSLGPEETFDGRAAAALRILKGLDDEYIEEPFEVMGGFGPEGTEDADLLFTLTLRLHEFDGTAKYCLAVTADSLIEKLGLDWLVLYDPTREDDYILGWQPPSLSRVGLSIDASPLTNSNSDDRYRLDYSVNLGYDINGGDVAEERAVASIDLKSNGYLVLEEEDEALDQITNEVCVAYHFFDYALQWDNDLFDIEQRRKALVQSAGFRPRELRGAFAASKLAVLDLSVNARTESDQDFDNIHYSVGAGLYATHSKLAWLGLPLAVLRFEPEKLSRFKAPSVYLGFDYVYKTDDRHREMLTDDDSYTRLRFELRWDNEMFPRTYWYSDLRVFWELNASESLKAAEEDVLTFWETGFKYYVWKRNAWFNVKYMTGKLPASQAGDDVMAAGLSFGF